MNVTVKRSLDATPRRTNECCLGDIDRGERISVYGFRYLLCLEGTALRIWQLIDGTHTINEIIDQLAGEFAVPNRAAMEYEVVSYFDRLEKIGLVAWRLRPLFEEVQLDGT
ncbi:MAG: PqqD family protein [Candidatus Lernaella stagnicola]|nr:PqqD family protein [Candidatus Lernaella stagnicola]